VADDADKSVDSLVFTGEFSGGEFKPICNAVRVLRRPAPRLVETAQQDEDVLGKLMDCRLYLVSLSASVDGTKQWAVLER
jgi:hypothetical protein